MKKVFALVLALALVFSMASVAMAVTSGGDISATDTANVAVAYTAPAEVKVNVAFDTINSITYAWSGTNWTTSDVAQENKTVVATNKSSSAKTIEITKLDTAVSKYATVSMTGGTSGSIATGGTNTATFSVTPIATVAAGDLTEGGGTANIVFTITIS